MVSGLFGPAGRALGAESILETSQHRKIVEVPSIAVVAWWNSAHKTFSMILGLMRGTARLLPVGGALLISRNTTSA